MTRGEFAGLGALQACALCGKPVRSVYRLPGDDKRVAMCSACFFRDPPIVASGSTERKA